MKNAIDIIQSEHRALAAVLNGLAAYVDGMIEGKYEADHELLAAMIQYVTELPDKVHHPKEDQYLFAALRRRDSEVAALIDELAGEHEAMHARWSALAVALADFKCTGNGGLAAFKDAVDKFYDFQWQHMSKEESRILPLARQVLQAEDWAEIDAAFNANDNPWEGPAGKYKALFTRIVSIAPAPIGVGDGHHA